MDVPGTTTEHVVLTCLFSLFTFKLGKLAVVRVARVAMSWFVPLAHQLWVRHGQVHAICTQTSQSSYFPHFANQRSSKHRHQKTWRRQHYKQQTTCQLHFKWQSYVIVLQPRENMASCSPSWCPLDVIHSFTSLDFSPEPWNSGFSWIIHQRIWVFWASQENAGYAGDVSFEWLLIDDMRLCNLDAYGQALKARGQHC